MISIIVPVYNVEKYLEDCISSIINQTYKDIEIILVDDGSTDQSPIICDKYKSITNFKVIHQKNCGVSSARNKGLDIAKGEYIMFVDADDYISTTLCEDLLSYFDKETDIVASGVIKFAGNKEYPVKPSIATSCTPEILKRDFDSYYRLLLLNSPVAKLYRKGLLECVRFSNDISMGEDFIFNLICFEKARNIKFVPLAKYYYNRENYSSATMIYREEYFNCYIKCYEAGKKFKCGEVRFSNDAIDEALCFNCLQFIQSIAKNVKDKKEQKKKITTVMDSAVFYEVCCGKYNFSLHLRLMQMLCKNKKYNLLRMFFALKKILSVFKR